MEDLQDSFWANAETGVPDWAVDDSATETENTETISQDKTDIVNPPAGTCNVCGEVIERRPGQRGRLAKTHPECRETRRAARADVGSISGVARTVRVSKAELVAAEETESIIASLDAKLTRLALYIGLVDPFDAFVIQINKVEMLTNLRPILMRYPKVRMFFVGGDSGASLIGIILSVATLVLPILAHHNLIPVKRFVPFLQNLPMIMYRMQQVAAEGGEGDEGVTRSLFARLVEQRRQNMEAAQRRRTMEENPSHGFATANTT